QSSADFLIWLGSNGFDVGHPEEEKKAIIYMCFVLTDFVCQLSEVSTEECIRFFESEDKGKRCFADGIGYIVLTTTTSFADTSHWAFLRLREARIPRSFQAKLDEQRALDEVLEAEVLD
ncbi:hypothetical protein CU097_005887, partial [Rhizopus azygosporus]